MPASENIIRIMCPNLTCKRILAVPDGARGKMVRCRGCGINLRIPVAKVAEPNANAGDASTPTKPSTPAAGKAA